jgi:hypothetical protein
MEIMQKTNIGLMAADPGKEQKKESNEGGFPSTSGQIQITNPYLNPLAV